MARDDPHFRLRVPADLKKQIEDAAEANGRSINAEIIDCLRERFPAQSLEALLEELHGNELFAEQYSQYLNDAEIVSLSEMLTMLKKRILDTVKLREKQELARLMTSVEESKRKAKASRVRDD